jgi:hypothetical protein
MPFDRQPPHRRFARRAIDGAVPAPRPPQRARLAGRLSLVTGRTGDKDTDHD